MKISQREARRLRKRVQELEDREEARLRSWSKDYPGGTHIATVALDPNGAILAAIETALTLRHGVVAATDNGNVYFYAIPAPRN